MSGLVVYIVLSVTFWGSFGAMFVSLLARRFRWSWGVPGGFRFLGEHYSLFRVVLTGTVLAAEVWRLRWLGVVFTGVLFVVSVVRWWWARRLRVGASGVAAGPGTL